MSFPYFIINRRSMNRVIDIKRRLNRMEGTDAVFLEEKYFA